MTKTDFKILHSMETRGGGLAAALAKAAYQADDLNFERIKICFPDIWEKHRAWVSKED